MICYDKIWYFMIRYDACSVIPKSVRLRSCLSKSHVLSCKCAQLWNCAIVKLWNFAILQLCKCAQLWNYAIVQNKWQIKNTKNLWWNLLHTGEPPLHSPFWQNLANDRLLLSILIIIFLLLSFYLIIIHSGKTWQIIDYFYQR